ncbi:MAG: hypothetical protein QOG84_2292 [Sphingomonadales bacterium]|jgi:hypothetical protein|nr:hypothetical protein [Sphingomonadales bacterium]
MADSVNIANWPDSGSHERVAFELTRYILTNTPSSPERYSKKNILDTYVECWRATHGSRD